MRLAQKGMAAGMLTAFLTGTAAQPPLQDATAQVSVWSRDIRPGEVLLVRVRLTRSAVRVDGTAFDQELAFDRVDDTEWHALAGVPLEITPGLHDIVVKARTASATDVTASASIDVQPGQFSTRQLRVDERFVNPPASAAPRIARERQMLEAMFAKTRPERLWTGNFLPPITGEASSSFGNLSIFNGQRRSRHQGTDFSAPTGTAVVAPNAGQIALATNLYFTGNTVVIDHGHGLYTLVAHLSTLSVKVGSSVARGDLLGLSGATGRATGPHLHWTVRLQGVSVNPLALIAVSAEINRDRQEKIPHAKR
jgi:murein DD-endopeptidase MepM/ murein hydrolase activator NlpD